jgi:O-antigen/teichoic acid export membrane protein
MTIGGLRQAALSGARWTVAARIGSQLFTWPVTILVIRLLDPSDYGLLAMATVTIGFIALFSEMGLSLALVQVRALDEDTARTACAAVIACNLAVAAGLALLAPLVAAWFSEEDLTGVMRMLTLELVISSLAVVPQAQLERQLRFKALSIALMASGASGAIVTLILALLDSGVWSLVFGNLTVALVRTTLIVYFNGRVVVPTLRRGLAPIRGLVYFGGHVLASRTLWYWYGQSDQVILARMLHASVLGYYTVAAQLAMLPVSKAMEVVNRIAFPILSRMRADGADLRAMHRRLLGLVAAYAFGICWGLASVAPELVAVVLGDKWHAATLPLALLSAIAPLRMLSALNNTVASAVGAPQASTFELAFASLAIPAAVLYGAWLNGLQGACMAWVVVYPMVYLLSNALTCRAVGLPQARGLGALAAPAAAAVIMWACVWIIRWRFAETTSVGLLFALESVGGGIAYALAFHLLAPTLSREVRALTVDLLRPKPMARG